MEMAHVDGLVQETRYSNASAMELHLSCTKPLIYSYINALIMLGWVVITILDI